MFIVKIIRYMTVCADFGSLVRSLVTALYKKRRLSSEVLKEQINAVNIKKCIQFNIWKVNTESYYHEDSKK